MDTRRPSHPEAQHHGGEICRVVDITKEYVVSPIMNVVVHSQSFPLGFILDNQVLSCSLPDSLFRLTSLETLSVASNRPIRYPSLHHWTFEAPVFLFVHQRRDDVVVSPLPILGRRGIGSVGCMQRISDSRNVLGCTVASKNRRRVPSSHNGPAQRL